MDVINKENTAEHIIEYRKKVCEWTLLGEAELPGHQDHRENRNAHDEQVIGA